MITKQRQELICKLVDWFRREPRATIRQAVAVYGLSDEEARELRRLVWARPGGVR